MFEGAYTIKVKADQAAQPACIGFNEVYFEMWITVCDRASLTINPARTTISRAYASGTETDWIPIINQAYIIFGFINSCTYCPL